jgi:hypothetical protein
MKLETIDRPHVCCSYVRPNGVACGDVLYDWGGVLHHFKRHSEEWRQWQEIKAMKGAQYADGRREETGPQG